MTYLLPVLAILGLEMLVAALIWLWWQTLKTQQQQFHSSTRDTYAKLAAMVEQTAQESHTALTSALNTAANLEKDVEKQSQAISQHTQELIQKQTEWQNESNRKLWLAYEDTLNQETKKATAELTSLLSQQAAHLSQQVSASLNETQTTLRTNLTADLQKAETEIENYKKTEIDRIHAAAVSITAEIVQEVIGRELSPADHHQLVVNQLGKALHSLKS